MSAFSTLFFSERVQKIVRYLISGGTAAVINLGMLFVLVHFFNFHYLLASTLGFLSALVVSFTMQKFWTFQNSTMTGLPFQFARYISVTLTVNLGLNTVLMYLLVSHLHVWYFAAQIVTAGLLAILSYFMYHNVVFKSASVQP